jgi:acyl-CoA synthetase (AMP-forming)/AMP-acid ligase II
MDVTMGPTGKQHIDDPTMAGTFPELIRAMTEAYGDKPAVVLGDDVLTYRRLEERSAHLAGWLLTHGVGKGIRVGILYANGPRWAVAWAASTRIGAVAVSLSTFSRPPELARVVRHADLHGLISQPAFLSQDFVGLLEQALPQLRDQSAVLRIADAPFLR